MNAEQNFLFFLFFARSAILSRRKILFFAKKQDAEKQNLLHAPPARGQALYFSKIFSATRKPSAEELMLPPE